MTMSATPCASATATMPPPFDPASAPAPAPMKVSVKVPISSASAGLRFAWIMFSSERVKRRAFYKRPRKVGRWTWGSWSRQFCSYEMARAAHKIGGGYGALARRLNFEQRQPARPADDDRPRFSRDDLPWRAGLGAGERDAHDLQRLPPPEGKRAGPGGESAHPAFELGGGACEVEVAVFFFELGRIRRAGVVLWVRREFARQVVWQNFDQQRCAQLGQALGEGLRRVVRADRLGAARERRAG